jgi:hypothetical protein
MELRRLGKQGLTIYRALALGINPLDRSKQW